MIRETLNVFRPSRCEKTGIILTADTKRDPAKHPDCPAEGCDILIQNGYRYGWSESNVAYQYLGPVPLNARAAKHLETVHAADPGCSVMVDGKICGAKYRCSHGGW